MKKKKIEHNKKNSIWISWEKQRRTIELAKYFRFNLFIIEYKGIMRIPLSIIKTIIVLIIEKPDKLLVQNPSMILAGVGCIYKILLNKKLTVDRHSNFMLSEQYRHPLYKIMFRILNKFTIKKADLTIVTNRFIGNLVKSNNGKSFILPDKIPNIKKTRNIELSGKRNVLFIASNQLDEPLTDVIRAINYLNNDEIYLYVTGDYKKVNKIRLDSPKNIVFTGFLPEREFMNLIYAVDVVMVLTKNESCLLCGCYEAISAEKPLITTNTEALKEIFYNAVFVDNSYKEIAKGIKNVLRNLQEHQNRIKILKNELNKKWVQQSEKLKEIIRK